MTTYIFSDVSYGETKFQPVTIEQAQKVKKKDWVNGNPDPGLRNTQKCGGVKPDNGIPTHPHFYNFISNGNTNLYEQLKKPVDSFPCKKMTH